MTEQEALRKAMDQNPEGAARLQELVRDGKLASATTLTEGEPLTIVAIDRHNDIAGSRRAACGVCKGKVWLAPSSQDILRSHTGEVHILCLDCMIQQQKAEASGVTH